MIECISGVLVFPVLALSYCKILWHIELGIFPVRKPCKPFSWRLPFSLHPESLDTYSMNLLDCNRDFHFRFAQFCDKVLFFPTPASRHDCVHLHQPTFAVEGSHGSIHYFWTLIERGSCLRSLREDLCFVSVHFQNGTMSYVVGKFWGKSAVSVTLWPDVFLTFLLSIVPMKIYVPTCHLINKFFCNLR